MGGSGKWRFSGRAGSGSTAEQEVAGQEVVVSQRVRGW